MSEEKSKLGFGDYVVSMDTESGQLEITETEPEGIIAQYHDNKIEQNTALQMMREYYNSQIEESKCQFLKAVLLNKPFIYMDAERILEKLNQKYFDLLQQLGLENTKERVEQLIQLKRLSLFYIISSYLCNESLLTVLS